MKRINNLYQDIYKLDNMMYCFNEVCKNTKNKNKVNIYKEYKLIDIYNVYNIKEVLKIKYYVRYQDDFILLHHDKEYLKFCLDRIKVFFVKEKLELNNKTRIYKGTNNITFLGRNGYNKSVKYREKKRKLKNKKYLYESNIISLNSYISSYINYKDNR